MKISHLMALATLIVGIVLGTAAMASAAELSTQPSSHYKTLRKKYPSRVMNILLALFDPDEDGVFNSNDNCDDIPNPDQSDLDGDGVGDACDDDIDGDGVIDKEDNCPEAANPDQADADGDGIGAACDDSDIAEDNDTDDDGVENNADNCPEIANAVQTDQDFDGAGDACDDDIDGDGVLNDADNCPEAANADQADADADGTGDACDEDDRPSAGGSPAGPAEMAGDGGCKLIPSAGPPLRALLLTAGAALLSLTRKIRRTNRTHR